MGWETGRQQIWATITTGSKIVFNENTENQMKSKMLSFFYISGNLFLLLPFSKTLPPFFEPCILLPIKPRIQLHYSWSRTLILVIFQLWASQARSKQAPLLIPSNLPLRQRIRSRREVLAKRSCQPIFHPCSVLLTFLLMQVQ